MARYHLRMRFLAPARAAIAGDIFDQPVFAGLLAYRDLLAGGDWPSIAALNARLLPLAHRTTGKPLAFVAQPTLAGDTGHYELRIFEHGLVATRSDNWHDLLNALVWKQFPAIKSALNMRQVENIRQAGTHQRTREQDALTQFDEAGVVLVVRDRGLLALWDAHDWTGLFLQQRAAWHDGRITLAVFGHALMEHALCPQILLAAKALVFLDDGPTASADAIDQCTATAIAEQVCLRDPQQLRPLPLSGLPGWHRGPQDAAFYRDMPCFRPLRAGRTYPRPLLLRDR